MAPVINNTAKAIPPRVLVVDDEPAMIELLTDVISRQGNCRVLRAENIASANRILASESVDLALVDLRLPDGDGMSLVQTINQKHPTTATVVITGEPSVNGAISAFRAGGFDFLPKPFTAEHLMERVNSALSRQSRLVRNQMRLLRLRGAVKKLNITRHTISKKVDLLCNDLVAAYGELSRQIDQVRMQESFRKLLMQATDLEQLLCHAMDWILRQAGYCNVAIWLASEEHKFELGAYMKYTIAGEQPFTDAMRNGLLPLISREGYAHLFGPEITEHLTPAECEYLKGQEILGSNCTYLGESVAAIVMFRDEKAPFSDDDVAMLKAISPIFAVTLAGLVRRTQDEPAEGEDDGGGLLDEHDGENDHPKKKPDSADWWKRGEPPPF